MIAQYLARLGITSGQACTLSIGLVLGGALLTVSVPPVWNRQAVAAPAPAVAAPLPAGTLTELVPEQPVVAAP
ncbi:MAG: hypothetical protein ABR614_06595, partial [Mycobacteriales bacterium]